MTLLEKNKIVGAATATWDTAGGTLALTAPAEAVGAGVRLLCEGSARDWSAAACLAFTLRANGAHRLRIDIAHGQGGGWTLYVIPRPGLTSRVVIPVAELRERPHNRGEAGYSRFGGGPVPVDLSDVRSVTLTFSQEAPEEKTATLSDFGPRPEALSPEVCDPRVVVDEWGQWIGERGAARSPEQIRAAWDAEPTAFDGFPGQTDDTGAFTRRGKAAEGTGFFRVAKIDSRWLLLDPDGYPFFSTGCNCVWPGSSGPAGGGREPLFADLTDAATRRADGSLWADFYERNLRHRYAAYGDDWPAGWAEQGKARLRRWGFNTIGNWSHPALTHMRLLPSVTNIAALAPLCGHLPDVFAPDFGDQVRALVAPEIAPYAGNPSLIGYFVGNEPIWTFGGHRNPFNDVFTSPEHPHTRERAIAWVRQTYEDDLARVNAAWGTALTAWDDLTRGDALPDVRLGTEALKRDADAFLGDVLTAFYDICCRAIRAVDPDHLLLGGRFYTPEMAEPYVRACRAFDVYSFNSYAWEAPKAAIERVTALSGLPVLIGEFHYGVEGRGLTASLIGVRSQHERGLAYRHYLENAAALPQVVGAHWFQWVDQPATGRFDGESYNIGLVDVTDIPYGEFLASVQEAHHRLPEICFGEKPPYTYPGKRPSAW